MSNRLLLALCLCCAHGSVSAERWQDGDISFELPEGLEDSRKVETLPSGLKKQSFELDLDGYSCAVTLLPPFNMERMLNNEPDISAQNRKQLETLIEHQRNFERDVAGDEELRYKTLQAMYIPYLADLIKSRQLKEISLEHTGLTYSEFELPLATTRTIVQGDGDPISIWATGVFSNMTVHITLVETAETNSEACGAVMEALLASYSAL